MPNPNWVKGVSGNPGGRPKAMREVTELARQEGPASIKALALIRDMAKAPPAARVAASTALLDRGFGKPTMTVETRETTDVNAYSDDQLLGILADRRGDRRNGAGASNGEAKPH